MSEENTATDNAGTSAPETVQRPEFLPEKFWDGEKGAPRVEEMARSYGEMERLIGARVGDLGIEARRKLAEALPDALRSTWADEYKSQLAADEAFLTPLEEAWRAKHAPAAPEAYEPPARTDDMAYNTEHPLYAEVQETAKKLGLPQDGFSALVDLVYQARADYERPIALDEWKSAIPDIQARATSVYNRLKGASPEHATALINQVRDPNAFLALEALVKSSGPKSLALEPGEGAEQPTKEKLDELMNDPRYWKDRDPAFVTKVTNGFNRLYGDTL